MTGTEIDDALLRRATGYEATETVEEFAESDGEMRLIKRKVATKNVPPDVSAAKLLMEKLGENFSRLSDEELEKEKVRLLGQLKEYENATK